MQALEEKLSRGMNLVVRDDESEDERDEGNVDQVVEDEFLKPKEEKF